MSLSQNSINENRLQCFYEKYVLTIEKFYLLPSRYMKYLYPYECSKKKLSTPAELQSAIDGNRRDSRRSFGSFLSQPVPSDGTHTYNSLSPSSTPPAFTTSSSPGIPHRSSPGPGSSASNHDVSFRGGYSLSLEFKLPLYSE